MDHPATSPDLTYRQKVQVRAIVERIASLIPVEGVDYTLGYGFGANGNQDSVTLAITPLTDKGTWWKGYVMEMLKKYPPSAAEPRSGLLGGPLP